MSEGAPLRTATVASMAAEQQARKVEQRESLVTLGSAVGTPPLAPPRRDGS